jgi:hypothetical protein
MKLPNRATCAFLQANPQTATAIEEHCEEQGYALIRHKDGLWFVVQFSPDEIEIVQPWAHQDRVYTWYQGSVAFGPDTETSCVQWLLTCLTSVPGVEFPPIRRQKED